MFWCKACNDGILVRLHLLSGSKKLNLYAWQVTQSSLKSISLGVIANNICILIQESSYLAFLPTSFLSHRWILPLCCLDQCGSFVAALHQVSCSFLQSHELPKMYINASRWCLLKLFTNKNWQQYYALVQRHMKFNSFSSYTPSGNDTQLNPK